MTTTMPISTAIIQNYAALCSDLAERDKLRLAGLWCDPISKVRTCRDDNLSNRMDQCVVLRYVKCYYVWCIMLAFA